MAEVKSERPIYLLVKPYKSLAASILLTVFLGPIGLLYGSFWGAVLMSILIIPGLFMPPHVGGIALFIFWLVCCFWGVFSVARYNKKINQHIFQK
jgi:hypothetical protein